MLPYQTFDELTSILQNQLRVGAFDVVCHAAAVSDFLSGGTFVPDPGTFFNARTGQWEARNGARRSPRKRRRKSAARSPSCGCD